VRISARWPFPWTHVDPSRGLSVYDFRQLMHQDAFGRDLCT
ncbi:unnamed protein product, partial [Brassica rapa subsp. trilocularis]